VIVPDPVAAALTDVSAVEAPTAPPKTILPLPELTVRICAPSIVLELPTKETFPPPPLLVSTVIGPVKATGAVIETAPLLVVVMFPSIKTGVALPYVTFPVDVRTELLCVIVPDPVAVALTDVSAVEAPTAPPKAILPLPELTVRICAPSIVLELPTKETFPPPPLLVSIVTDPIKVTGPVIETAPLLVELIFPPSETPVALS